MRKLSLIFSLLIALVGFNANAAMYLVGEAPLGKGWDPSMGNEMTDNNDGTYSYVATINGTVYFCFADALGENSNDWNNFNSNHRYGPSSGDQNVQAGSWITTQRGSGAYMFTGTNQEYEITFDANQNKFKIDGYVAPINPYTGKLFILGQVNGNNWNPTTGVEMEPVDELLENIFELEDVTVTDSGDGYGYFSFTTKLGENADDWSFLPYRRGAVADGTLVENDMKTAMGDWGTANAFKVLPGTYDFTVSIKEGESAYVKVVKKADPTPTVDDVYILGEVNGNGWAADKGIKMTLNEGVYTASIITTGENDGKSYFSFTKQLADSANGWDDIAAYRFGAESDGDFWMTEELLGVECALVDNGQAIAIPAGEWTVTVNLDTYKFTIDGTWPVDTVTPEPEADVYILGEVNGNGWAADKGVKMTLNEGVYTANITTAGENDGKSYFSFTKQLADSANGWDDIAAYRFGAESDGDFWMTEELLGVECALVDNGQAIAIPAGEWTVTVNLDTYKFTIDGTWPVDTVTPEPEADVYILGEVNGNGWAADKGVKMTLNEGVYTANITTAGENDGKSYFSFTKQLADSANGWDDIAAYRFGAESDGDFWMTEELLGVECALVDNGQAIAIPAGEWTVTVNLDTYKFTIDGTWPVDTVTPEPEADVYIIGEVNDNGGWFTNKGVKMTLNEGVYTANITTAGENDGLSYFSFTKQLADSAADWEAIAPYRFGPVSEGDFIMTEELLGQECALTTDGSNAIAVPAGEWTVTVNLNTYMFTIDGTWPVDTVTPEPEADVYIIGEVNDNGGWFTNKGVKMTLNEGVYTANITTAGENDGLSYFSFTKQLADSAADWEAIAPYRFGPVSEGDFIMTEELLGVQCALVDNGQAIAIPAGEWTVTVDLNTYKFTIDGTWPIVEPEHYDGDVYILGDVNDNGGWFTNKGVKMTRDEENYLYTATITTTGEAYVNPETGIGYSYFSFTKQLVDSAADWEGIAPYRFGAISDGDFWVTDETLGTEIALVNQGATFQIPAGEWNLTLSVDNMTLKIEKAESDYILGDVDMDNLVKINDVTVLINYLLSGNTEGIDLRAADCDKDTFVKINDVTTLINFLLSGKWE